jgi:iron complex outermembrane receptor protein
MLYASYNHGFRSGSFNTVGVTGVPVDPETIDAYEIGLKSEWMDNRLRLNGAAFFYDFTDLQVVISRGSSTDLLNAGKAEIYGLDLELQASVTDNLTLRAGGAFLDTEYTSSRPESCVRRDCPTDIPCTRRRARPKATSSSARRNGRSISA